MCAVEGWLGVSACRGHVIVSEATVGNTFSRLAPIGRTLLKNHAPTSTEPCFVAELTWWIFAVVEYVPCSAWRLRCSMSVVGDGWGYRSSILRNCDIGIAAAISILQLRYRDRSPPFCVCLRAIPPTPPTPKLT